ncbi:MAG: BrnT family toxin [Methylococcaceae bacterium]|nr:BrnT family toxin [Methylococcaceae bacterium]
MKITYDPDKRDKTLKDRGIDFEEASEVFAGATMDFQDTRQDYGETRIITFGFLDSRMVVIVWTQRGETRHIISMRKANEREIKKYTKGLEQV